MDIRKFAYSLAIASALIAGVIVVMADWKNSASAAPQNQLHLAEKAAWWAAM